MTDYDFSSLNDKEFEILCIDLLSRLEGVRFERFKQGKDSGIDGRYFAADNGVTILQCKHWIKSGVSALINHLNKKESGKVRKLNPKRYILATSVPLSPPNKESILKALSPYLVSESDIHGQESLNDILRRNSDIERSHYKLWIHSTAIMTTILNSAIIGRSADAISRITEATKKYVVTENHNESLERLESLGVLIITGEPGIGKTTLAEQIALHYVADGYQFFQISDDVKEAESVLSKDDKQIFYFDDFLGSNYLESLSGREGTSIINFIKRISTHKDKKKFILTSRSTILNQGKFLIEAYEQNKLSRNEYELNIGKLSQLDKARILYNHIWFSSLSDEQIDQLYEERRYRIIIEHKNFNPRLISYVTDSNRLESIPVNEYWVFVEKSLNNPADIWEGPFSIQVDDFCRALIALVVFQGGSISESTLSISYYKFKSLPQNSHISGRSDFLSNLKLLTGSFLNRVVSSTNEPHYTLFNPSISDFVLQRYKSDLQMLCLISASLYSRMLLSTLRDLHKNSLISPPVYYQVINFLVKHSELDGVWKADLSTSVKLCHVILSGGVSQAYEDYLCGVAAEILNNKNLPALDESLMILRWALENDRIEADTLAEFIADSHEDFTSDNEIIEIVGLISALEDKTGKSHSDLTETVMWNVIHVAEYEFKDFFDAESVINDLYYPDYDQAKALMSRAIKDRFGGLGLNIDEHGVDHLLDHYDFRSAIDERFYAPDDEPVGAPRVVAPAGNSDDSLSIYELFDRSNQ